MVGIRFATELLVVRRRRYCRWVKSYKCSIIVNIGTCSLGYVNPAAYEAQYESKANQAA